MDEKAGVSLILNRVGEKPNKNKPTSLLEPHWAKGIRIIDGRVNTNSSRAVHHTNPVQSTPPVSTSYARSALSQMTSSFVLF